MFSPVYFEKVEELIECLHAAADIAYEHSKEIGLPPQEGFDLTPICTKCFKRKKLNFGKDNDFTQQDAFEDNPQSNAGNNPTVTSQLQNMSWLSKSHSNSLSSPNAEDTSNYVTKRLSRRHNSLKLDRTNTDSTFMSAIMKTLVTLNSSSESLNRSAGSFNEASSSKKKAFLRRRHTMLMENSLLLSSTANAAVGGCKNNVASGVVYRRDKVGEKKDNAGECSERLSRKLRPSSYPNSELLGPHMPAKDNKSQESVKIDCEARRKKGETNLSPDCNMVHVDNCDVIMHEQTDSLNHNRDSYADDKRSGEASCSVALEDNIIKDTTTKKGHQAYYSLSPMILDSPLKLEDLGKSVSAVTVSVKSEKVEEPVDIVAGADMKASSEDYTSTSHEDSSDLSHDSSLSSNPEYFAVISKSRKRRHGDAARRQPLDQSNDSRDIQTRSLPAKTYLTRDVNNSQSIRPCKSAQKRLNDIQRRTIGVSNPSAKHFGPNGGAYSALNDDSDVTIYNRNMANRNLINGSTSCHHGDGLLFTSSFGIGDYGWCQSVGESDLSKDGYCKCSFCNHEMIFTPMRSEVVDVNLTSGTHEATSENRPIHLESFTLADLSMTSLNSFNRDLHTHLQEDHFPYPRLPKEFMTSQCDNSMTPQYVLDSSMNASCSCDEDSGDEDQDTSKHSSTQKVFDRLTRLSIVTS